MPLMNVVWVTLVTSSAIWAGVPWATGATPTDVALLTSASCAGVSEGRCADQLGPGLFGHWNAGVR
jgi:hypothetical protein